MLRLFDHNRRAVTKHFRCRDSFSPDLRSIVSKSHDRVGPHFMGMLNEKFIRLLARLLAHLRIGPDLTADNRFQSAQNSLGDGGRATINPRTIPIYCTILYPSIVNVVVTGIWLGALYSRLVGLFI